MCVHAHAPSWTPPQIHPGVNVYVAKRNQEREGKSREGQGRAGNGREEQGREGKGRAGKLPKTIPYLGAHTPHPNLDPVCPVSILPLGTLPHPK